MDNFIEDEHGNAITSQDLDDFRLEQGETSGSQRKKQVEPNETERTDSLPEKIDVKHTEDVAAK